MGSYRKPGSTKLITLEGLLAPFFSPKYRELMMDREGLFENDPDHIEKINEINDPSIASFEAPTCVVTANKGFVTEGV